MTQHSSLPRIGRGEGRLRSGMIAWKTVHGLVKQCISCSPGSFPKFGSLFRIIALVSAVQLVRDISAIILVLVGVCS